MVTTVWSQDRQSGCQNSRTKLQGVHPIKAKLISYGSTKMKDTVPSVGELRPFKVLSGAGHEPRIQVQFTKRRKSSISWRLLPWSSPG